MELIIWYTKVKKKSETNKKKRNKWPHQGAKEAPTLPQSLLALAKQEK